MARRRIRPALVAFLAREADEEALWASGWEPSVEAPRWYAAYTGGRRNEPYRMPGPSGWFTRYRGDHPERLYRLDHEGGWVLDGDAGRWERHDAPVRLHVLEQLTAEEVEALYELDDWGGWYFDYAVGCWTKAESPSVSYYLAEVVLHEVDPPEAARVATALGCPSAVPG
ncbi:MAG: hypothetical protein KY447_01560 [Actinobacteria bacterium]|nr:hypothetical protein [Actinomycetota bacterium]MBW3641584.1 hypothetical protein [Actinomycetota bacterium]